MSINYKLPMMFQPCTHQNIYFNGDLKPSWLSHLIQMEQKFLFMIRQVEMIQIKQYSLGSRL